MFRAIIIDDEEAGVKTLRTLAERNAGKIRIVASTLNASEGIMLIEDYKPELVFLDINMPEMSGFTLLDKLSYHDFRLVFTTAHKEYALQAIKKRAFDYLLKPISDEEFRNCLDHLTNELKDKPAEKHDPYLYVEIRVKDGVIYIRQEDIVRLEASGSYTEFHMDNGTKHIASKSLGDFETRLDLDKFYRCHKSHIINLRKVQKFINHDGFFALMSDGSTPDISKSFKDDFLQRLATM